MHFTGNQRDTETGLDYFGARYLGGGNGLGRFMTPEYSLDSAIMELPQSWNKYTYEYNRPTYGTDPDGRCPPCIGAVIGGVVEGGFDLGKQLYNNGGQFSQVSWGEVGANVVGGAVAGAIAGATGGASLVANAAVGDVVAGVTSGVVGGVVTRTLDPNTTSDEVLSGGNIAEDAVAGFVGGGAGHMAGDFVHIPDEPTFHLTAKSRRAWKFDIRAGLSANAARNWQQLANQGVRSTVTSSAATHTSNGMWDWFEQWWFNQSPPPENPHSTSQIIYCTDENGNPCR